MGVERLARRSFGFVVAALLGLAIYFQAAGTVELVAARALVSPAAAAPGSDRKGRRPPRRPTPTRGSANGDAILARNPFDSVTGPLDRAAIELALPEPGKGAKPSLDLSDPLNAPECPDVAVNIVTESADPEWSVAQLKGPGDSEAATRRVGDEVGKFKVAYIGFNSAKLSPAVWLVADEHLCQALLFSEKNAAAAPEAPPPPAASAPAEDESRRRGRRGNTSNAPALPAEIADKIQKISDTEFAVDRSVIDNVLENQAQLMRSARIVPEQKDGKTVGIRLFGIRPDTLLGTLGLQNGDRLEKINGFDMASPEKALEAYARLRTAPNLSVQLTRRGKPTTLEIQIK